MTRTEQYADRLHESIEQAEIERICAASGMDPEQFASELLMERAAGLTDPSFGDLADLQNFTWGDLVEWLDHYGA